MSSKIYSNHAEVLLNSLSLTRHGPLLVPSIFFWLPCTLACWLASTGAISLRPLLRTKTSFGKPLMQASRFLLDRGDGTKIQVHRWAPDNAPKAAIQISHGMCEHAGRYERLARALTAEGYLVYASDHRGHGPNTAKTDLGHLANQEGWRKCLDDLWAVNRHLAANLFGLGSPSTGDLSLAKPFP
jgi:hypothetical protein